MLDRPRRGPVIGFMVRQPDEVDVPALESPEVWDGPRFDVPALALAGAAVGHILLAVRGRFEPGEPTSGAMHFHRAIELADGEHDENPADPDIVIGQWRLALEAGESKALFGLGYTLVEAGRPQEAYGYLRRYCELTPHNAWAWCWLGRACSALGDVSEARAAFEHAIACESQGSFQTDARDLPAALGSGSDE